jgi:hypothetical protein
VFRRPARPRYYTENDVRLTPDQIGAMLAAHVKWLRQEEGGSRADLTRANLTGADLTRANLTGAYLTGADLTGADLSGAYLFRADLTRANLTGAYLTGAYLTGAYLTGADLSGAYLTGAYLTGAYLTGADLSGAYLSGADLSGADLTGAKNAELAAAMTEIVPREGEVIGWKKCRDGVTVKVRVPPDAKRSNATGRKCRAERVEVLEVVGAATGVSMRDGKTKYAVGEIVTSDGWTPDRWVECGQGIHFFLTMEEAQAYTG